MQGKLLITRCAMGAIDLYHGIPNLLGARIVDISYEKECNEYCTHLHIEDVKGTEHVLTVKSD